MSGNKHEYHEEWLFQDNEWYSRNTLSGAVTTQPETPLSIRKDNYDWSENTEEAWEIPCQ
jgi:hypothetical protein